MKNSNIPEKYQTVMPYLILNDASGFLSFMEKVFGAELIYKEMRNEKVIRHAEISVGESVIMFANATPEYTEQPGSFFIYVNNADETFGNALNSGASALQEPSDQPYGRSGGVKDPFGNTWWMTSVPVKVS